MNGPGTRILYRDLRLDGRYLPPSALAAAWMALKRDP